MNEQNEMVAGDTDDMAEALAEISAALGCANNLDDMLHAIDALRAGKTLYAVLNAAQNEGFITDSQDDAGFASSGFTASRAWSSLAEAFREAYAADENDEFKIVEVRLNA